MVNLLFEVAHCSRNICSKKLYNSFCGQKADRENETGIPHFPSRDIPETQVQLIPQFSGSALN